MNKNALSFMIFYIAALCGIGFSTVLFDAVSTRGQTVQMSWSTKECVKVVSGEGSCDNLPERYQIEWVK